MQLRSDTFADGEPIPEACAFGKHDPEDHVALSENHSPHLEISGVPAGTRSLVLLCVDPDVPSRPDDVNQEGRTVPASLPRVDFYHWVLVDLPPDVTTLAQGAWSRGITAHGKPGPAAAHGARQGKNDYTGWFAGDPDMEGAYFGYDGPCPPWNDERLHHYRFTVYALAVARCPVEGEFGGADVLAALEGLAATEGQVLGTATLTGTYHIYPDAR